MINDFLESLRLGEQYDTHGGELFKLFAFWTTLKHLAAAAKAETAKGNAATVKPSLKAAKYTLFVLSLKG